MHSRPQWRWLPDGLPHLIGWRWWAFLTVWLLTLAVTIAAAAWTLPGLVARVNAPPSPNGLIGLTLDVNKPWPTIRAAMGPEAVAARLTHGDRIVAIDGRPPAPYGPAFTRQLAGPIGGTVAVTVQTPVGAHHRMRLTRDPDYRPRAFAQAGLSPALWPL